MLTPYALSHPTIARITRHVICKGDRSTDCNWETTLIKFDDLFARSHWIQGVALAFFKHDSELAVRVDRTSMIVENLEWHGTRRIIFEAGRTMKTVPFEALFSSEHVILDKIGFDASITAKVTD